MAWRFKASKYKNAAPIVPKPETCIRDICVGSYQTYGNNIAASAAFMAFNWEHAGSSLAVLPIDDCGRKTKTMPLLHGHSDTVTDLSFSPFHDGLLATGSQDCLVKIWHIPEKGLEQSLSNAECTFSHKQRRVETVGFHPTADCLLYSTAAGSISLWDLTVQQESFSNNQHPEVIQSLSWKHDGTLFATSCKDKMLRIIDPRSANPISMSSESHQSIKDSRVVWLGDQNRILTTGFDASRLRQIIIRDLRNLAQPEKTLELDCSTGILMPLYDADTNMLFLAGKGDITISYLEVTDKDPYLIEGIRHSGEQTKGACLVPKRALRVMEGEVNRVLQLTSNMVIPIMYQVPRKTYRDFHGDLYPETNGCKTELTATQWFSGTNAAVPKISLDPAKRELGEQPIVILRGNLNEVIKNIANKISSNTKSISTTKNNDQSIVKPTFVPIKDKIKQMENKNKCEMEKSEFEQKFKEVTSHKDIKNNENTNILIETSLNEESFLKHLNNMESESNGNNMQNNQIEDNQTITEENQSDLEKQGNVTPPKPMPRTSRTNSVSDQSFDESNGTTPRPVARPRTTSTTTSVASSGGGYKPRLGPKPFSSSGSSSEFSFDKVFAVPQVPGAENSSDNKAGSFVDAEVTPPLQEEDEEVEEEQVIANAEIAEDDVIEEPVVPTTNGDSNGHDYKNGESISPKNDESEEPDFVVPRTPSTAERRKSTEDVTEKIFELKNTESDDTFDSAEDKSSFDRLSGQRSSIAERRRIYEKRSQSVQDEKPASPTPLLRRESMKPRNESEENKRNSVATEMVRNKSDLSRETMSEINKRASIPVGMNSSAQKKSSESIASKRTSTVFGKVSKFRHLKGTPSHKSTHLENLRNLSRQIPGECDGFHANYERVAVPLSGPGGKISIYELSKPGRQPDGVIPSLVNGNNIMDFQWDPFNPRILAVACDDGCIKLWEIPDGGLIEPTNTPNSEFVAHSDKIYIIKFHPIAKNVLLSASYDMTMKIWDLDTLTEKICLKGHNDQIFNFAWSPCGVYGATVCKDGKIRIYNPRKSDNPIREGPGPVGTRGARLTWAIEGEYIVVMGFDKVSERQISIYKASDLSAPLNTVSLDVSPAILVPFYDEDSSTLFVTGKGDSTIYAYEITDEHPYICPLSHHRCASLHQGLSFLQKNQCDVTIVEFAKALRLTNNTIEPLSFTVPRLKNELFQDDLFPPTRITWSPTMTSSEWFAMKDKKTIKLSLQPEGMEALSSLQPVTTPTPVKKNDTNNHLLNQQNINNPWNKDLIKSKQDEIQKSVSARLEFNPSLEQDHMEGVDEKEWEE